ncbi:MinD/ParA family ATP-binding protein [Halobellus ruber]|uniref:CobQ/CobB/MinD/ParA nucleotide binding domain-containing protein n=1 Tax=Halobellus ruber TaxID=2761102 RepID=A0A7J9SKN6_9EURY|nr:hypothetical protein [Halobellus ruber]MBB6646596.1 hypothetical protein [Halobellus ruber]
MSNVYTVVGVTSGVGATETTAGLGRALADSGEGVLLIDWDRSTPDLAARMGLPDPEFTIRDLETGEMRMGEVAYTGQSGVRFLPGCSVDESSPDDGRIDLAGIVGDLDGVDATILIDTGEAFTPAAADAFEASDGVLVVSTPDSTARRHAAVLRESLRNDGHRPLGTVLNRTEDTAPDADGVLARVPEVDNFGTLPGGSDDARADAYRRLADELERVESAPDTDGTRSTVAAGPTAVEQQSADGFVTPSLADPSDRAAGPSSGHSSATAADDGEREVDGGAGGEQGAVGSGDGRESATDAAGEVERGASTAGNEHEARATSTTTEADDDPAADAAAPATAAEGGSQAASTDGDDDRMRVSRRAALTLITGLLAAVSGGSLWIDSEDDGSAESSPETASEEVVGFGYGGTPITEGGAAAMSTATGIATTEDGGTGGGSNPSTSTPTTTATETTATPTNTTTATPTDTTTATPTNATTATRTPTSTPTSAPSAPQGGAGGPAGGGSGGAESTTSTAASTSTTTTTTTSTPTDDGDNDDYGEVGYGEGGYGGTV